MHKNVLIKTKSVSPHPCKCIAKSANWFFLSLLGTNILGKYMDWEIILFSDKILPASIFFMVYELLQSKLTLVNLGSFCVGRCAGKLIGDFSHIDPKMHRDYMYSLTVFLPAFSNVSRPTSLLSVTNSISFCLYLLLAMKIFHKVNYTNLKEGLQDQIQICDALISQRIDSSWKPGKYYKSLT